MLWPWSWLTVCAFDGVQGWIGGVDVADDLGEVAAVVEGVGNRLIQYESGRPKGVTELGNG